MGNHRESPPLGGASGLGEPSLVPADRWMARLAVVAIAVSAALVVTVGIQGPSAAVVTFPVALPWPPWFAHVHPSSALVAVMLWLAVMVGAVGLMAGLAAVRRGWRPPPRRLIIGSFVAVVVMLAIPPVGSADMLLYVVSGRIAVLGHSPYVMTPGQLKASGDPVGTVAVRSYPNEPTRYGPVAAITEAAASELAGTSVPRAVFWLKVWNALAYLALVLALDRIAGLAAARRVRVHLLWSVNPLMLWAVMAGGHNDVLSAAAGATALFALRRVDSRRALLAGILVGVATAIKVPFALFGGGLAWAARRSPRALTSLALGALAIVVPSYVLAGRAAISVTMGLATSVPPVGYVPWFAVVRLLGLHSSSARIATLPLIVTAVLAVILLWRMPSGSREFPAVRVALALTLAWLVVSPQQRPWYYVMIFPLLAVIPASRLDWIVVADATAVAAGGLPRLLNVTALHPAWLSETARIGYSGIVPIVLAAAGVALLWLCFTNKWGATVGRCGPPSTLPERGLTPGAGSRAGAALRRMVG
jgi:hypothetical protein